jgi:hypothetical protein
MKAKVRLLIIPLILAAVVSIESCRDPQSTTDVQVDTVYVGSLLESGEYYYLTSAGINGVDALANMRLMFIDPCDTCANGWKSIIFSSCPDSTVNNAQDIIITHTPISGALLTGSPIFSTDGKY